MPNRTIATTERSKPNSPATRKASVQPSSVIPPLRRVADSLHAADLAHLQRTIGNQAVQRMVERRAVVVEAGADVDATVQRDIASARSAGQALDANVGTRMGHALGTDFSGVRVHTDAKANSLNRSLSARASTLGRDIFFSKGAYQPNTPSGDKLLAHELTRVAQQGGSPERSAAQSKGGAKNNHAQTKLRVGAAGDSYEREAGHFAEHYGKRSGVGSPARGQHTATIQRAFGKKKKDKPLDKANQQYGESGKPASGTYFIVRAAVKTGTKTRGNAPLSEILGGGTGHSWLEIELGPNFPKLQAMEDNAPEGDIVTSVMSGTTRGELDSKGKTTVGFYPTVTGGAVAPKTLAKQLFANLPGHLVEPEQAHFAGSERGAKGFAITDSTKAIMLLNFINGHRNHPYNVFRYNCTDFVVKTLKSVGLSIGATSNALGWTMPALMYKRIYQKAELGDQSSRFTGLSPKQNSKGKTIDVKHVTKKSQKRLDKRKDKMRPTLARRAREALQARVIQEYAINDYVGLKGGSMTRPGTKVGATGVFDAVWGEVVMGGTVSWVDLMQFERVMGFPYPGAKSQREAEPIPDNQIEQFNDVVQQDLNAPNATPLNVNPTVEPPTRVEQAEQDQPPPIPTGDAQATQTLEPKKVYALTSPLTITRRTGEAHTIAAGGQIMIREQRGNIVELDGSDRTTGSASLADVLAVIQQG